MQKITTFMTFNDRAEEAVEFYVSIFQNSKVLKKSYYGEGMPMPAGTLMTADFVLEGQEFVALNGGPSFVFSQAFSLMVNCDTQEEIDHLWDKLTDGGEPVMCGWLTDKFGVSWQITPRILLEMINDPDPAKAGRATQAMMEMVKLDIATLKKAYDGE
ncbi:MAG: VOC family protein [Armatimonadetes bacterium]|nr:VOC family protein [Armatimonadota bacterium]